MEVSPRPRPAATYRRKASQAVMNSIPLVVAVRTYQVFPFDFSAYEFNWTALARIVIGFTVVAVSIALLVELVKLVRFGYEAFQPR